ncbi:MAG: KinB-signaling pathway activation protein [Firmicutes bacterium]|nr:KinB-signaling pathway activation protein [Bacillota bacterium]
MNQTLFWRIAGRTILIGVFAGLALTVVGWPARLIWYRGMMVGGSVSVEIGLMGFWAFLTLNFLVRTFLPLRVWIWFQGVLVVLTVLDISYYFPALIQDLPTGLSLPPGNYLWVILIPLVLASVVAVYKARRTTRQAFIPALFFMYVFTGLEWILALLNAKQWGVAGFVWIVLFLCNAYLVMALGQKATSPSARMDESRLTS